MHHERDRQALHHRDATIVLFHIGEIDPVDCAIGGEILQRFVLVTRIGRHDNEVKPVSCRDLQAVEEFPEVNVGLMFCTVGITRPMEPTLPVASRCAAALGR